MKQDILAANILFGSEMAIWQVPFNVYKTVEISFAELIADIKPCGTIGAYLCEQMFEFNDRVCQHPGGTWPHGETWCIGDNPTASVLLQSDDRQCYHTEKAPFINDDYSYRVRENAKDIRVYDSVDARLTLSDLKAKLKLCYGK